MALSTFRLTTTTTTTTTLWPAGTLAAQELEQKQELEQEQEEMQQQLQQRRMPTLLRGAPGTPVPPSVLARKGGQWLLTLSLNSMLCLCRHQCLQKGGR